MAYKDDSKFSVEDFANTKSIDDLVDNHYISDYNVSDDNGYTPLCFMTLNGCRSDLIVYLVNNKDADPNKTCDKGSTPLELACMSCNAEAVKTLVGQKVTSRDENGDIEYTDVIIENPKKDAAGNPIPKRDENDDIVYIKDKYGTPLPLCVEGGIADYAVQYRAYSTYKDESTGKIIVGSVCKVPQATPEHPHIQLKYKYDEDGNHQPMRDEEGNPYKQYDKDTLQPINKIDDETLNPIRNKFEYVWDYEYLPEYEVGYEAKTCKIDENHKKAKVTAKDILKAASNKDSSILEELAKKYEGKWDTSGKEDITFSDSYESPLIAACRMQAMDSVNLILKKISHKDVTPNNPEQGYNDDVIYAALQKTKEVAGITECVYSIAEGYKDETIFKAINNHIDYIKSADTNNDSQEFTGTFSDYIIDLMVGVTNNNAANQGESEAEDVTTYYKLLNLLKGSGDELGKFSYSNVTRIYCAYINEGILKVEGDNEYVALVSSKWPEWPPKT